MHFLCSYRLVNVPQKQLKSDPKTQLLDEENDAHG